MNIACTPLRWGRNITFNQNERIPLLRALHESIDCEHVERVE